MDMGVAAEADQRYFSLRLSATSPVQAICTIADCRVRFYKQFYIDLCHDQQSSLVHVSRLESQNEWHLAMQTICASNRGA